MGLYSCGSRELCDYTAVGTESCKTIHSCGNRELWDYTAVGIESCRTVQQWEHRAIDYTQLWEAVGIYSCGNREL